MPFDNAPQRELTAREKTELDVLTRARALIEDPRDWCHGAPVSSVEAPYCAMTACYAGSREQYAPAYAAAVLRLSAGIKNSSRRMAVADFNDHPDTTHADVLALYDRAIASLQVP